ncbi:MAG: leucine-rich repeat domain-containing protein [Bacteroidales bacterium]|nr:leucine-rich repeat domain-containing protein [Bacteroidales bacterium]
MGNLSSPVFEDCTSLETLNIGENVKIIPDYAFHDCNMLTEVTIPDSITSIGELAFGYCQALQTINFYARNCTIMGGEYESALFASPVATVNFGEHVKIIPEKAFYNCSELTEMRLPDSVTNIGAQAFSGCSSLTGTLIIPDSVKYIGDAAFNRCSGFTGELVLPNSVKIIGMYAFCNCGGITSVTLGNSIDSIKYEAFYNCDSITDIYSLSITPPFAGPNLVSNSLYQTVNVWVPCATIDSYRSINQWNRFANIRSEQTTHYNIEVETDDANMGDVTGAGSFTCDTEVVLVATPNDGYRFVSWNDGNEDNPRTIVVAGDSTFTASFRAIKTITATAGEGGTIAPSGNVTVDEGTDEEFTITPNECYAIASVLVDGIDVTDELVDSIYTFTNVTTDHTIDASFVMLTYTITATAGENGTITPSGESVINCGDEQSFIIIPDNGYLIASVLVDGAYVTEQLDEGVYTFTNVTANHTIEALFEAEPLPQYTITILSNNDEYGSVSGGGTYEEGTDVVITAMPNSDYCFLSWDDGDTFNPRTITVTSDSTFVADFSATVHFSIDTIVTKYLTMADRTFYVAGQYSFVVPAEIGCDTIFDLNLHVLDEPETYDISPNPAKSIISISSENYITHVEFYTTTGRPVMQKVINAKQAEINMESFVSGVYFIRLYGEGNNLPAVFKIVKE